MIDFRELIKAGAHFGHITSRLRPEMRRFVWGRTENKIALLNVQKTAVKLEEAAQFLKNLISQKNPVTGDYPTILLVGTKKPAQDIIRTTAEMLGMPSVTHRWIGGTLTNPVQVKRSVTKLHHFEDVLARADKFPYYTKKEFGEFQKNVQRLQKNIGGIRDMRWPVGAIFLVDVTKEKSALREAKKMGVPVVAIVDTNGDPSLVDYVIPANDDAPRSIELIVRYIAQAIQEGQAIAAKNEEAEAIESSKQVSERELTGDQKQKKAKASVGATKAPKDAEVSSDLLELLATQEREQEDASSSPSSSNERRRRPSGPSPRNVRGKNR